MGIQIYYQKWDEKSKASHELLEHVIRIYAKAHQIKLPETLQIHQEKNKKPFLEHVSDICFSISHSGEWWSCAIAPQEVGLDIQEEHDCKAERLAKRFFHPMEVEWLEQHGYENFCRLWAYKESYVKYTGIGLVKGMDYYSVVKPDGTLTGEESVWQKQIAFQSECYMVVTAKQEAEIKLFSLTEQGEK